MLPPVDVPVIDAPDVAAIPDPFAAAPGVTPAANLNPDLSTIAGEPAPPAPSTHPTRTSTTRTNTGAFAVATSALKPVPRYSTAAAPAAHNPDGRYDTWLSFLDPSNSKDDLHASQLNTARTSGTHKAVRNIWAGTDRLALLTTATGDSGDKRMELLHRTPPSARTRAETKCGPP